MSVIQDFAQHGSIMQFTPEELRAWRLVLAGLRVMHAPMRLVLAVSCPCLILAIVVDRSDRALPLMFIAGGQVLLAIAQVAGLIFACFGPAGSETRRRARQTSVLMFAAVFLALLVLTFYLGQVLGSDLVPLGFWVRMEILGYSLLSLLVNVALVEAAVIGMYAAMGRDLGDPGLSEAAHRLAIGWLVFFTFSFALVLLAVLGPLRVFSPLRLETEFVWLVASVVSLLLFEALYSRLANRGLLSLRKSICDVRELHALRDHPGASM